VTVAPGPAFQTVRRVPYVDLAGQHRALSAELLEAVARVIAGGRFILGDEVAEFEERFARLCGVRHAIAVNSGSDALTLALRALGIGAGDQVITAPNSFVASASSIVLAGAEPVFADVGGDYNLDPLAVERAITPKTRAVMPVHLTGRPADMESILAITRPRGIHIVEDCAQAVLAEHRGRRVGAFGGVGCFSLHPLKTLNACGDGGVMTTDDDAIARDLRMRRNIGLESRDSCVMWAGNSRLDTLQAAILLVKLNHLERWTEARRAHARRYQAALAGVPGVDVPVDRPYEQAVYHTFVIQADRRDALKQHLSAYGIETAIHYPIPIHLHAAAKSLGYGRGSFPVAEAQAGRILSLPVYPELTEDAVDHVAHTIRTFYGA
jgi:dTDP-4-amino-4,6-dideoxygalactose transaminase